MEKWTIDKEFTFEYGHRVWNQSLDSTLSDNAECKCRFVHGHSGRVKVGLSGERLLDGMVIDFNNLKFFKNWLDDVVDHKTIIDINDPLINVIIPDIKKMTLLDFFDYRTILPQEGLYNEFYGSFVIVDFVPTSENFAKWFHLIVEKHLINYPVKVEFIDFFETAKSHCRYQEV